MSIGHAFYLGIFIALFVLLMVFGVYIQSVFADEYRTIGIRHATNPVICVFEPDPSYTKNVTCLYNYQHLQDTVMLIFSS